MNKISKIEYVPIWKVKNNPNNPRLVKDDKFKKLVKSIQEFPEMLDKRPIIVNEDMIVLGGNMRLKACNEAGLKEIPIIVANWSEEQQRAFIIKDNLGYGEWDWDIIANEWDADELNEWGLDIPNYEGVELDAVDDDYEADVDQIETDIVLGDLFEIGEHRLLCGSSTNQDDVDKLLNDQYAELLFTSPPYSDMRDYNGDKDLSVDHITEFITSYFSYSEYQAINLGIQRKDHDINEYWNDYIVKAKENGYKFLSWNIWHKSSVSVGQQSAFIPIYHEWIFVFGKKFKHINRTWSRDAEKRNKKNRKVRQSDGSMKESSIGYQGELKEMESVFYSNVELGDIRSLHPATFPVELPSEYIKAMTNQNDLVIEPFMGSGTTMVAAHQLNRKCYGMELDPKYCQVIIDRMRKLDSSLVIKRNGQVI